MVTEFYLWLLRVVGLPEEEGMQVLLVFAAILSLCLMLALHVIQLARKKLPVELEKEGWYLRSFQQAVEAASDHITITDEHGDILYVNPASELSTGWARAEVIGKKAGSKQLWGGVMDQRFYERFWSTIKDTKRPFGGHVRNKRKDGQIYDAFLTAIPILDQDQVIQAYVGVEHDITKERKFDRAKTEFVSLASHQLRTPLSTIGWYVEMLMTEDAGKINDAQRQYLEEVYSANKRMVELINAFLNVSRLELGSFIVEPEPTQIVPIAETVIKEERQNIEQKHITLTTKFSSDIPTFSADPKLIRVIFQNLISNSIKYTPDGGSVGVEIALQPDKKSILIKVSDSGYGIPKDQHEKIFTKLFRADNVKTKDTGGNGLGLYIVKSIVDHSRGKIWFDSEKDKGTKFYVTLPVEGMRPKEGATHIQESTY